MWLFNAPPKNELKSKYGFEITDAWLGHLQLASVRFNNGGSGAFVSADGLTLTNHHVAADCLHGLSGPAHDYYRSAFYARTRADEPRCPNLELNVLQQISDVTAQIEYAIKPGMTDAEAGKAERSAMAEMEKNCATAPDIRCDVVTLYGGAMYHLYRYKKYTDVRLVFAPEFNIAFFGGDPDNFEYPRYDLDVTFFRVYEGDKPAHVEHYLRWSRSGVKDGGLVFVSGNPGSTHRWDTMNQLEFLKSTYFPFMLKDLERRIALTQKFSAGSEENAREAQESLFGLQNAFKAYTGYTSGLDDHKLMQRKIGDERRVLVMSLRNPRGRQAIPAMQNIDRALVAERAMFVPYAFVEKRAGFRGRLNDYAVTLVRAAAERAKPNGERLREYRQSNLPSLEQNLFSGAPVYKSLESVQFADSLAELVKQLGPDDAVVKKVLGEKSPDEVASAAIAGTHLDQVSVRKQLYEGGADAVNNSTDPLIAMMRAIDSDTRAIRKKYEDEVETPIRRNAAVINRFRFQMGGMNVAPDATFTLRLSYGVVKGYEEDGQGYVPKGTNVPDETNIGGAFTHADEHGNKPPYELPESWMKAKKKLKRETPLNFVSTDDIIGGNSGSPVVNRAGELVGVIFDGNIQSLPWDFLYDERTARAVSVDERAIIEALKKVYHADAVVKELMKKK